MLPDWPRRALASRVVLQAEHCPLAAASGCLPWLELLPAQVISQGAGGLAPGWQCACCSNLTSPSVPSNVSRELNWALT